MKRIVWRCVFFWGKPVYL